MTVCKCGARWETRDSTPDEWRYGMCEKCIAKARENGEIPPKRVPEGISITSVLYEILCGEIDSKEDLEKENKKLKERLENCTKNAKEAIRKKREENAIRWANIGR